MTGSESRKPLVTGHRFPPHTRLRTSEDFSRCFATGKRAGGRYFVFVHRPAEQSDLTGTIPSRLGLAVSRKVDPRAVERNRIKRIVREWFRQRRPEFTIGDLVVVGKPAARRVPSTDLRKDLDRIARRLQIEAGSASHHNARSSDQTGDSPAGPAGDL